MVILATCVWFAWIAYQSYRNALEQNYLLLEVRARQHEARICGSLRSVNLVLGNIIHDLDSHGALSTAEKNTLLTNYLRQLPELRDLLVTDASGYVSASSYSPFTGFNAAAREYFKAHYDNRQSDAFHVSRPFMSVRGKEAVTVSRAIKSRQGVFSGTVVANLDSRFFDEGLRPDSKEPGLRTTLVNLHGDILNQYPPHNPAYKSLHGGIAFTEHLLSDEQTTRHIAHTKPDNILKISVFRNLPGAPLAVVVAKDYREAMSSWYNTMVSHVSSFAILAGVTLYLLRLLTQRQLFMQDIMDSVTSQIAVVDRQGIITTTNRAWNRFAVENDSEACVSSDRTGVGVDYLEVCKGGVGETDSSDDATAAFNGISQVLAGELPCFSLEYPCNATGVTRWFLMNVTPLGSGNGAVIVHNETTSRKMAETELATTNRKLETLSSTDELTGIANRRHFNETLQKEYARHARSGAGLSLIMIDIDHFKAFNDEYGHLQGDRCLRMIGKVLADCTLRQADLAARYGGEEFACILPETGQNGAMIIAERIRRGVMGLAIPHSRSQTAGIVTASLGVVTAACSINGVAEELLGKADKLLYQAKAEGRNRVICNRIQPEQSQVFTGLLQLVWNDDFCSGNQLIDEQHQLLFKISNHLFEAIQSLAVKSEVLALANSLIVEAGRHFHDEEQFLMTVDFPDIEEHMEEHAWLLANGRALLEKFANDELPNSEICTFLVKDVVLQHMLVSDRQYFEFFESSRYSKNGLRCSDKSC